jgi:hypothetical protein
MKLRIAALRMAASALAFAMPAIALSESASAGGRATLPLDEVFRLKRAAEEGVRRADQPPPVAGTVDRAVFEGRVLDDAVDLTAHFDVTVLADGNWVEVPLLRVAPATHIARLPDVEGASLLLKQGQLYLATRQARRYDFEIGIVQEAAAEGEARQVKLPAPAATLTTMRMAFDQALFELLTEGAASDATGVLFYPEDGEFSLRWRRIATFEERPAGRVESRRPLVTQAHASAVSTLGARRITRILYDLRLTGEQSIAVTVPTGQTLEEVYLNGVRMPFERGTPSVEVAVRPVRSGDERAALELMLTSPRDSYLLSGRVDFDVPAVSWPTNELYVDLHLPEVFSYSWIGGSLAPVGASPRVEYANDIPTPGKTLSLHQVLVDATTPTVRVAYAIELNGRFFAP